MAQVEKFTKSGAYRVLLHNSREAKNIGNPDIDPERTKFNYRLFTPRVIDGREMSDREYYKQRLSELRVWNRKDVKTLCSWVVHIPEHVKPSDEKRFFTETLKFIAKRYGANNIISAEIHKDEKTPHAHIAFVPTPDGVKVSAKEVINLKELYNFHDDFQSYMDKTGIKGAKVKTGYTKANGGNRTVKEMKREREAERAVEIVHEIERQERER